MGVIAKGIPGQEVARVYAPPCPWDTHYQFSIKTLLSNVKYRKMKCVFGPPLSGFIVSCSVCYSYVLRVDKREFCSTTLLLNKPDKMKNSSILRLPPCRVLYCLVPCALHTCCVLINVCLATPARICLCRRSRHGRRRLFAFYLSRQRQQFLETRISPFSQPLQYHSNPQSTRSHTAPLSPRSPSAPAHMSLTGKRTGPANNHVGNNKKKHKPPPPTPPVRALQFLIDVAFITS